MNLVECGADRIESVALDAAFAERPLPWEMLAATYGASSQPLCQSQDRVGPGD